MTDAKACNYCFDYTKTMMMKLGLAFPDRKGGSTVINTFADALEIIKRIDSITLSMPKIIYLVGWQYNGHDDKYPDFFEVNEALRLPGKSPLDSLLWLIEEAKKYHTTVSVHINFNDAYENAPSFERFIKANALIRNKHGMPAAIENYNGLKCYKTSFVEYWESGLFKEMFDRLLTVLPLEELKTVHVDNFQCYKNFQPYISIREMQQARKKMIEYVRSKGIDITSEFTYREHGKMPNKPPFEMRGSLHSTKAPIDILGQIPAVWWCSNITKKELLEVAPQEFCGGIFSKKSFRNYLYGNMHGEDIFAKFNDKSSDWEKEFINEFALTQLPFQFLCNHRKLEFGGGLINEYCIFECNIISCSKNKKITVNGNTVKEKDTIFLPLLHLKDTYIAYSRNGSVRTWDIPSAGYTNAQISIYDSGEYKFLRKQQIKNSKLELKLAAGTMLLIRFGNDEKRLR